MVSKGLKNLALACCGVSVCLLLEAAALGLQLVRCLCVYRMSTRSRDQLWSAPFSPPPPEIALIYYSNRYSVTELACDSYTRLTKMILRLAVVVVVVIRLSLVTFGVL